MFGIHDPSCEESDNFATAVSAASREVVGWAANAVMVEVVCDRVRIGVQVEALAGEPAADQAAELLRDGRLEAPGGLVSVPQSVDEAFQRGVELPDGPGTYGVRVLGYGRARARRLRSEGAGPGGPADIDGIAAALAGIENYRICLWQVSSEPRWEDDE
ncbi:hypothetical protein ACIBSW_19820 [Actinoplanes sp. NPDC049668]|uniref:hypothetical protein n=1 Tax=unclassified Actinoplanes TaxID=2626549 RepID=UPI0033AC41C2